MVFNLLSVSAGDWLAFGGAIIGAIATIVAVIITIKYEAYKTKRENIISVKPWLIANVENMSYFRMMNYSCNNYIYLKGRNGTYHKNCPTIDTSIQKKCEIYAYKIKNVGANTATNLQAVIGGRKIPLSISALAVNAEITVIIILEYDINLVGAIYEIGFTYTDILSAAEYDQRVIYRVENNQGNAILEQEKEDLFSNPKLIKINQI